MRFNAGFGANGLLRGCLNHQPLSIPLPLSYKVSRAPNPASPPRSLKEAGGYKTSPGTRALPARDAERGQRTTSRPLGFTVVLINSFLRGEDPLVGYFSLLGGGASLFLVNWG